MKKLIFVVAFICSIVCCLSPITAFASDSTENDAVFTHEEFDALEHSYATYSNARATGLIVDYSLGIAKSGNTLIIRGYTYGSDAVIKCGFTEVVIQRRANSNSSWSDYLTYEDLYSSSNSYTLSKSVSVTSGYQYRVTAKHYAKKSLFSTEKITATTGSLSF